MFRGKDQCKSIQSCPKLSYLCKGKFLSWWQHLFRRARGVTEWLGEFENDVIQILLPWQSPDLNPTAHLWEILDQCTASPSSKHHYSTTVYAKVLSCYSTLSSHICNHTCCTSYLNISWLIYLANSSWNRKVSENVFNVYPWYVLISVYLKSKSWALSH